MAVGVLDCSACVYGGADDAAGQLFDVEDGLGCVHLVEGFVVGCGASRWVQPLEGSLDAAASGTPPGWVSRSGLLASWLGAYELPCDFEHVPLFLIEVASVDGVDDAGEDPPHVSGRPVCSSGNVEGSDRGGGPGGE